MKVPTKEEMAAVYSCDPVALPVPEWGEGCGLFIRKLLGRERQQLLAEVAKAKSDDFGVALLGVVFCACLEDGSRLFADGAEVECVIRNPTTIARIGEECFKANGLWKTSLDDAKKN